MGGQFLEIFGQFSRGSLGVVPSWGTNRQLIRLGFSISQSYFV